MKRKILTTVFFLYIISLFAQNGVYYVQGIPSSDNIGGVEVNFYRNGDPYGNPYLRRVVFKNYRDYCRLYRPFLRKY